jgi:multiple sugar transport system substrate-binding protein
MLSIRKGLALSLVVAMAFASGCTAKKTEPVTPTPVAPAAPVKISFWHGMSTDSIHGKTLTALVKKFNETHKDIVVEELYQGSYTQLQTKLTGAIASQTPPTVVQATDSMLTTLVQSKVLQDLTAMVPAKELLDYPQDMLDARRAFGDGKLYALPFNQSMIVMIYDTEVVKTAPKNWDDFQKIAKEVTTKDRFGTAFSADVYYFGQHFEQAGGEWLSKDGTKTTINSDAGVAAMKLIVAMQKNGSAVQLKPTEYQSNYFNEGKAAMIATTSASFAFIKPTNNHKWGVAPLYTGPKNDHVPFSGASIAILNGIKPEETKAGATFITWLSGTEATLQWATAKTGYMPVRLSAVESVTWKDFVKANPEYQVLGAAIHKGAFQPMNPKWGSIQKEITAAVEKAVLGTDAKAALDEAATKVDAILAKK